MDLYTSYSQDTLFPGIAEDLDLQERNEQQTDTDTAEAWRRYFEEKKKDQNERENKRPKVPLWIFQDDKPKDSSVPKLKSLTVRIESVRRSFLKASSMFWDETRDCLYFVDAVNRTFLRFTPATEELKVATFEAEGCPTFMIPIIQSSYEYVVGIGDTLYRMEWNGKSKEVSYLTVLDAGRYGDKINYGKADPVGRLVMATQREVDGDPESTSSDSIHPDVTMDYIKFFEAPDKLTNVTELTIGECTGIAWDWKGRQIYIINNNHHLIHIYSYNIQEGRLNKKLDDIVWNKLPANVKGFPQCLTCDLSDNLWVGCSIPGQIVSLDPTTKSVRRIIALKPHYLAVTSIVFGNTNRDVLYVTTSNWMDKNKKKLPTLETPRTDKLVKPPARPAFQPGEKELSNKLGRFGQSSLLRILNIHSRGLSDYKVKYHGELSSHEKYDEKNLLSFSSSDVF